MAKHPPERVAAISAVKREEKRRWLEHLQRCATEDPSFQRLCSLLDFFTGVRWDELTDGEFTILAAEYWKMKKPTAGPPPAGPVQRPAWLTQAKIDRLMACYADNGEPITENEAVIAWTQFMDWTRELADMERGEGNEEARASQE